MSMQAGQVRRPGPGRRADEERKLNPDQAQGSRDGGRGAATGEGWCYMGGGSQHRERKGKEPVPPGSEPEERKRGSPEQPREGCGAADAAKSPLPREVAAESQGKTRLRALTRPGSEPPGGEVRWLAPTTRPSWLRAPAGKPWGPAPQSRRGTTLKEGCQLRVLGPTSA